MTLSREDKLKLAMLYDVLTSELEYYFLLNYDSDENKSIGERTANFYNVMHHRLSQTPNEIAKDYDEGYWGDWVRNELKELYPKKYQLGEKVTLYYEGVPVTATIVQVHAGYGLFIDSLYRIIYVEHIDTPTNYIIQLQKRINVE